MEGSNAPTDTTIGTEQANEILRYELLSAGFGPNQIDELFSPNEETTKSVLRELVAERVKLLEQKKL